MTLLEHTIAADLPVAGVRGFVTTRAGGWSTGPWAAQDGTGGLNLGLGSGDSAAAVVANRRHLAALLPQDPKWLRQVHGAVVVDAEAIDAATAADASTSITPGTVCVVLIADCMPVLIASRDGRGVGAAHAGWRGLAAGVIQNTVRALRTRLNDPGADLVAYLGPAIGPRHFEVGAEVRQAMRANLPDAGAAFEEIGNGKYRANLFELGRMALAQVGVQAVRGGQDCTFADASRFYSYRRDRVTGRHAAVVWIDAEQTENAAAGLTPGVG
ncbi:MAG TPA: peptidoglycan editing factor PgeF [Burkholderiaceae bacterium]|nr:peptidoglycan editing factor PgeF [Burkholderiaceae bacterium]